MLSGREARHISRNAILKPVPAQWPPVQNSSARGAVAASLSVIVGREPNPRQILPPRGVNEHTGDLDQQAKPILDRSTMSHPGAGSFHLVKTDRDEVARRGMKLNAVEARRKRVLRQRR